MKYIEKKKRGIQFHISTTFAIVGFCIFSFLLMPLYQAFQKDLLVGVQFLLIGFISISALFLENEKRSFSLSMSVYFFWFYNKCWGLVDTPVHKTPCLTIK